MTVAGMELEKRHASTDFYDFENHGHEIAQQPDLAASDV